jgi:1-deoxy-D-xylulose-5-phosphate reductoisomerase
MRKSICILGSTGSIGQSTIEIILKNKSKYKVLLLVADKNYKKLYKQAVKLNSKYIYINDKTKIKKIAKLVGNKKIKIIHDFKDINNILKKKIDLTMSAVSGIDGLKYNLMIIKHTKKILLANKESIICGWNLIKKELNKFKTIYQPVDSEHFAIYELMKSININMLKDIHITASGGPFLNTKLSDLKNISIKSALNHPKWKMGKKISIDSATLMNKIFEVMEAYRLFNFSKNKIKIIIHPQSFVHAIINLKNGVSKALMHNTDMKIPILASIEDNVNVLDKYSKFTNFELSKFNQLNFFKVDKKKFSSISLLNKISFECKLFDTVLISANDELVQMYLEKQIKFLDIIKNLKKIINLKQFNRYRYISPRNYDQIYNLSRYVRLKTRSFCI